jgi:uncharacterized protein YecT (DUF1311 family)
MQSPGQKLLKCLLATLFVVSLSCIAQDSALYRACNQKAKTQLEMNTCASKEAGRAESTRSALYGKLLASASGQPDAVTQIKSSEKAWIAYRDAYLDAMYPAEDKRAEYGSMFPMEADLLLAKLTRQHIADLRQLLNQYKN